MNFFLEKQLIKFSCTYQPLSFCKSFKNILRANPELWGCAIFGPKMVQFPPNKIFFGKKLLISFSSTYWPLSLYKIFKKFLKQIQSYQDMPFLGPKCHLPKREFFFRKPVNKPCSFHSCLLSCQKSKSDINLLMKNWWLKNTEISLAKSHFWL